MIIEKEGKKIGEYSIEKLFPFSSINRLLIFLYFLLDGIERLYATFFLGRLLLYAMYVALRTFYIHLVYLCAKSIKF